MSDFSTSKLTFSHKHWFANGWHINLQWLLLLFSASKFNKHWCSPAAGFDCCQLPINTYGMLIRPQALPLQETFQTSSPQVPLYSQGLMCNLHMHLVCGSRRKPKWGLRLLGWDVVCEGNQYSEGIWRPCATLAQWHSKEGGGGLSSFKFCSL